MKILSDRLFPQPEALLGSWPQWGMPLNAPPVLKGGVPGGRTNRNFRLGAPGMGQDLLLRVNHPDPVSLGIDRDREHEILSLTARAGIGRPCLYRDPNGHFALFPWLEARTWSAADFASPVQRDRLWSLIERLGTIETTLPRRQYGQYLQHYWTQLDQAGLGDPDLLARWREFQAALEAFDRGPWTARLVHHDLIPANVLETSERLYLIDWEYAAPGHPDIDRWSVQPDAIEEPFIPELMGWINTLWERLMQA